MITIEIADKKDFKRVTDYSFEEFSKAMAQSKGISLEEVREQIKLNDILPQRVCSPDHEIYLIKNVESEEIGFVWIALRGKNKDKAFGYDIQIYEKYRNQGYGTEIFKKAKEVLKERGIKALSVHVFAHNKIAYNLYKKVGFEERSINMSLTI